MASRLIVSLLIVVCPAGGCVEIQNVLSSALPGQGGARNGLSGGDGASAGEPGTPESNGRPVVTLGVSNADPAVDEEVSLRCSLVSGGREGLTFAFQPADALFDVNAVSGTAVFIPSQADVGAEFAFTCTGTNDAGTGEPSGVKWVIPTSSD